MRSIFLTLISFFALGVVAAHAQTTDVPFDERTYELFAPEQDDDALHPLVIMLHGGGGSGARSRGWLGLDELAQERGFFVVYPDGLGTSWNYGAGIRTPGGVIRPDDVGFLTWLIDTLAAEYPIDTTRVFVAGMSDGAQMVYRFACVAPERLAGVAGVASTLAVGIAEDCTTQPLPMLLIHGSADPIISWDRRYNNAGELVYFSATDSFTFWARRNGCDETADAIAVEDLADVDVDDSSSVRYLRAGVCDDDAEVRFYGVIGGGHTWPSHPFDVEFELGALNRDIDASEVIMDWFAELAQREE
jgi:polyhydroxybutyrate depolymerase